MVRQKCEGSRILERFYRQNVFISFFVFVFVLASSGWRERSLKRNDSEQSHKTGSRKSGVVSSRAERLIAVCQSNLGDTIIA